ncbi:MAG: hypothetical protein ABR567_13570 [Myxococcales bacterium]
MMLAPMLSKGCRFVGTGDRIKESHFGAETSAEDGVDAASAIKRRDGRSPPADRYGEDVPVLVGRNLTLVQRNPVLWSGRNLGRDSMRPAAGDDLETSEPAQFDLNVVSVQPTNALDGRRGLR